MRFPRSLVPLHLLVLLTPRDVFAQTTCRRLTSSSNTLAGNTPVQPAAGSTGNNIPASAVTMSSSGTVTIINSVPTTTTMTMSNTCPMDAVAQTVTIITTLPADSTAFTSTIGSDMETLLIGVPATNIPISSATDPGTVTITSSIPAGNPAYTSTFPEVGTQSGTVIIGVPSALLGTQTTTITLDPSSSGFTSTFPAAGTNSGTVIIGTPGPDPGTFTYTTTLDPNAQPFTSTIPAASTTSGTVIVGVPGVQPVTTTITSGDNLFTTTTTGATDGTPTVLIVTPTPVTVTSTVAAEVTSTFTVTGDNGQPTIEVDLPCRTPGLRAGFYNNPYRRSDINTPYSNFDPSVFPPGGAGGTVAPLLRYSRYNGDIAIDVTSNTIQTVYGQGVALEYRTVQVQTYIYSPVAATIKFQAQSDDIGFGYIGNKAYTGPFTRANADEFEVAGNDGTAGQTRNGGATITVAAGSFTPLRFINGFDLYTYGANAPYHMAIINYKITNTATGAAAQYKLYSDVCPQDAADFPPNGT